MMFVYTRDPLVVPYNHVGTDGYVYVSKGSRCIYSYDLGLEGNFVSQEKETVSDSTFHFSYTMKY